MNIYRNVRRSKTIPLTSLIDIVFLLVIFFMLTTSFLKIESIEIGVVGTEGKSLVNKTMFIDVSSDGSIFINGAEIDKDSAKNIIATRIKKGRNIILRSGKNTLVQKIIDILDIIYMNGAKNISINEWDNEKKDIAKYNRILRKTPSTENSEILMDNVISDDNMENIFDMLIK